MKDYWMVRATQKKKDKKEEKQVASLHSRSAEFWIIYFSYTTCTGEHLFAHTWHFINLFFFIDEFRWRQKLRGVSPPAASNTTWFTIYRTASCIDCITETKSQMTAVIMSSLSAELQGECFMLSLSRWSQLRKRTIIELNRATCAAESLSLLQYYTNKQFLLPKCIYFQFEIRVKKDRNNSRAPVKKHQQYLD